MIRASEMKHSIMLSVHSKRAISMAIESMFKNFQKDGGCKYGKCG